MEDDDHLNDETFGNISDDRNQLPHFFQTNATTVLEELEAMKLGGGDSDDEEAFPPAPLPSFFDTNTPPTAPVASMPPQGVPLPAGAKIVTEPGPQQHPRGPPPPGYFPVPPPGMHPHIPPGMPYPPPWAVPGMPYPMPPMQYPRHPPNQGPRCPTPGHPQSVPRPTFPAGPRHPRPPQRLPVPANSMMSQSDARYVVSRVLMTLEVKDPYADDFYYIQKTLKKAAAADGPSKDIRVPLPSWSALAEAREAIFKDSLRAKEDRSRKWEEKEGVLGHIAKNEISKPRNVVSLTPNTAAEDADESIVGNAPFSTVLWNMRQAVHRGFLALASVQELQMLLMTPSVACNPVAHAEIVYELGEAQQVLSRCVGVKVTTGESGENVMLEGGLVAALLQTVKGKKLLARAFPVLGLDQRWALLPVIIARMLHKTSTEQSPEDVAIEKTLLMRLTDFIATEYEVMMTTYRSEDAPPLKDACAHLLSLLRQCLKTVLVSQMEKAKLRASLIASRQRAEVMHVIVRTGDKLSSNMDKEMLTDWMQLRDAFMLMLEE